MEKYKTMTNKEQDELIEMINICSRTKTFKVVLDNEQCKFLNNVIEDLKYLREKQKKGR